MIIPGIMFVLGLIILVSADTDVTRVVGAAITIISTVFILIIGVHLAGIA